ncbi:MAG: DUF1572 family protein [Niabella sp.]
MNSTLFIKSALQQFKDYKDLAEKTFVQLQDEDFYYTPDAVNNSIAVIITHLHGNMLSRWINFLTEDGEKHWRKRDEEFESNRHTRAQLLQLWEEGWQAVFNALEPLTITDFDKVIYIRTKPLTVIEAIHRQLTHYASHVGQIIYIGKHIKGKSWQTLSIAKGASKQFNEKLRKS